MTEPDPFSKPSVKDVLSTIVRHGPMSRLRVAEHVGLTGPSVTKAARRLIDSGYLVDDEVAPPAGQDTGRLGRPTKLLRLVPERETFVGVNVTTDELIATVVDLEGTTLITRRLDCDTRDPQRTWDVLADFLTDVRRTRCRGHDQVQAICLALSGEVDRRHGLARYSPFIGWRDVDVVGPVQQLTGITTLVDNDVHALTVAEMWSGAGLGSNSLALVTVGDGVGCGLVIHDKIIRGAFDVAGELGHIPIARDGPVCQCGQRGCLETFAAAQHIIDRVTTASKRSGLTLDAIADLAARGDPTAVATLVEAGEAMGRGIATLTNLIGVQKIIVSPSYTAPIFSFMDESLRQSFAEHAFGAAGRAEIVIKPTGFADWSRAAAVAAIEDRFAT